MNREQIIEAATKNLSGLRKKLRRHVRGISDTILDDCCQESFLWILENISQLQTEIGHGPDAGKIVLRHMVNASARFIRSSNKSNGSVSLSHPLSDEEGADELGDLVVDASTLDPERTADGHRAAGAMVVLGTQEARILMAFADEVPVEEIALEHKLTPAEVLLIKHNASEKIKAHAFAHVLTKTLLRPLRAIDLTHRARKSMRAG